MSMLVWRSPAKLNWYLRVLEPRADGYHDLQTLFQELDLADEIAFEPLDSGACEIVGMPSSIALEQNLIYRAWDLLRGEYPEQVAGIRARVDKRLPAGGGLGGGSSNAAATLKAVAQLFALPLDAPRLEQLGARLGSDVAFFVRGGCAVGLGRGERLQAVETQAGKEFWVVLAFPGAAVSTAEAYARLDRLERKAPGLDLAGALEAVRRGEPEGLAEAIHNDFELAAAGQSWFEQTRQALRDAGALRVFLCGSGSTLASLAKNQEHACEMVCDLRKKSSLRVISTRSNRASTRFDKA